MLIKCLLNALLNGLLNDMQSIGIWIRGYPTRGAGMNNCARLESSNARSSMPDLETMGIGTAKATRLSLG